ncbi:MAG: NUDIX domain-containing protein [Candidatus Levybacteria bacterium]|nr:NUDIX domain-containing protein [Candidatus Levybacteria bacterium]
MNKKYIDKLAFIFIKDKKILVTLSIGKNVWYIPGGKRENKESDIEALTREVKEELSVDLKPETISHYGTFGAQAHGKPIGVKVRMTCYTSDFEGTFKASNEIGKIDFFDSTTKELLSPVDYIIFADLKKKNLID